MSVSYKDGKIIVDEAFHNDTNYDVANNLITACFCRDLEKTGNLRYCYNRV